jgi:hypothetical protein
MTLRIAGHCFNAMDFCETCPRKWTDIMHVDMSYINEPGYAHCGNLNSSEINEIMAEKKRRDDLFAAALKDIAA